MSGKGACMCMCRYMTREDTVYQVAQIHSFRLFSISMTQGERKDVIHIWQLVGLTHILVLPKECSCLVPNVGPFLCAIGRHYCSPCPRQSHDPPVRGQHLTPQRC